MPLTVVTLTQSQNEEGPNGALLSRCKQSVANALPPGAKHEIVFCPPEKFAEERMRTALMDEYVCSVDDDDVIDPRALRVCLKALQETGAGLACTNEAETDINLNIRYVMSGTKLYQNASRHPRVLHHLAMWQSKFVDPYALELNNKYTVGIDWFIKVSAALQGGAVHIPMTGYFWCQHEKSMTHQASRNYHFRVSEMRNDVIARWGDRRGFIPVYPEEKW